jgi:four helix bundle protein
MALVEDVYRCTARFPREERFGLVSQIRRSAVSIASNIAEGSSRRTTAELLHFLYVSRGSLAELRTQLEIAVRLGYASEDSVQDSWLATTSKLLNALINRLRQP